MPPNEEEKRRSMPEDEMLDGWKAIGDFFRRSLRTVQMWEKRRRLPVHRINELEKVFAYRSELEAWRRGAQSLFEVINVLQHTYGAEYGKRAGGQITIVTSSGTNQLHGDAFEFLRNIDLDARNFFDQTIGAPPFRRNQFGGALGGPLRKDKIFLFGNYEGFRQRLATSSVAVVPDASARLGLLPCYIATPNACGSNPSQFVAVPNLQRGMLPYAQYFWPAPNSPEILVGSLP